MEILLDKIDKVKEFVHIAESVPEDVTVVSGRYVIDGKSIMGILSLNLLEPVTVDVLTSNTDLKIQFFKRLETFAYKKDK